MTARRARAPVTTPRMMEWSASAGARRNRTLPDRPVDGTALREAPAETFRRRGEGETADRDRVRHGCPLGLHTERRRSSDRRRLGCA